MSISTLIRSFPMDEVNTSARIAEEFEKSALKSRRNSANMKIPSGLLMELWR